MENPIELLRQFLIRRNRQELVGFDVKEVRTALEEERALKEQELADLFDDELEISDIETAIASFAGGGPEGNDSDNEGDDP